MQSMPQMCDLDYNTTLQLLNYPHFQFIKLTAMYNIVSGYSYYPSGIFTPLAAA